MVVFDDSRTLGAYCLGFPVAEGREREEQEVGAGARSFEAPGKCARTCLARVRFLSLSLRPRREQVNAKDNSKENK